MHTQNIRRDFDIVAARERDKQLGAAMPRDLSVVRNNPEWVNEWDSKIGQSPSSFYETLCRNIDGQVSVFLDFFDSEDSNFNVDIVKNRRVVFKTENKIFHDVRGKFLYFKEWKNKDTDSGRYGMGLNLFRNVFDNARVGKLDFITLRGGREDGRFFWPAHGFYFRDPLYCDRALPQIANNLEKYSDTIPDGILKQARGILDQGGLDACWKIARLPGAATVEGRVRPLGWALLNIPHESEYQINLNDHKQVERVQASLVRTSTSTGRPSVPIVA